MQIFLRREDASQTGQLVNLFMVASCGAECETDHKTLPSDLSFSLHSVVFLGPASKTVTLADTHNFNQQLCQHRQPQPAASSTLISQESHT